MNHRLKTWPEPFAAVRSGDKPFEIRQYDRPFAVGDTLELIEYIPGEQRETGHVLRVRVTYFAAGPSWGLPEGLCVMGVRPVQEGR